MLTEIIRSQKSQINMKTVLRSQVRSSTAVVKKSNKTYSKDEVVMNLKRGRREHANCVKTQREASASKKRVENEKDENKKSERQK